MFLCDVGNTSFAFLKGEQKYKKSLNDFDPKSLTEDVYYICVNPQMKLVLDAQENWIDISQYIDKSKYYETMGIDRIVACEALTNAVLIDAGSAITVDVVKEGVFVGGYIYPGTRAMQECYTNISEALDYEFNYNLNLDTLPKNSQDALSYGYLKLLYLEVMSHKMDIVLTGGDADKLSTLFPSAKIDNELIFNSMKKIVREI